MMLLSKKEVWTFQKNNYHPFLLVSPNSWLHLGTFLDSVTGVPQGKMQPFPGSTRFSGQHYPMPYDEKFNDWFIMIRCGSFSSAEKNLSSQKGPHYSKKPYIFHPLLWEFPYPHPPVNSEDIRHTAPLPKPVDLGCHTRNFGVSLKGLQKRTETVTRYPPKFVDVHGGDLPTFHGFFMIFMVN